jgi:hypothetical protein
MQRVKGRNLSPREEAPGDVDDLVAKVVVAYELPVGDGSSLEQPPVAGEPDAPLGH